MCNKCLKGYSRKDRLTAHLKTEHNIEESKQRNRFKCPFCDDASFHTFNQLKVHCEIEHEKQLGNTIKLEAYLMVAEYHKHA